MLPSRHNTRDDFTISPTAPIGGEVQLKINHFFIFLSAIFCFSFPASAENYKSNVLNKSYQHDRWGTQGNGIVKDFAAYRSSFDDLDDDDGDGRPDAWGVPEWVAYEIKKFDKKCIKTFNRPNTWITDADLNAQGIMPTDTSYSYPKAFRNKKPDWFVRGHLAAKVHAERISPEAAWNTHTFYNAVPQRQSFNAGIWLDLENLTAAWAQRYGAIWVITGPIFVDRHPYGYLGKAGDFPIAIPEALFKIVIKDGANKNNPDVLAFVYPQISAGYLEKHYDHTRYLTTIDEIEALTGIDFLTALPKENKKALEVEESRSLWPVEKKDFIGACKAKMTLNE